MASQSTQQASDRKRYFGGPGRPPDFCKQRTQPMEVLVLGLSRTGTTSMLSALQTLDYGTCYNAREMWARNHSAHLSLAADAKFLSRGPPFTREQFESLWGDYRAISGEPAIVFKEELLALYLDAKVILTVRDDEDVWFASLERTMWYNYAHPFQLLLDYVHPVFRSVGTFRHRFWRYVFMDDFPTHGRRVYREHEAWVRRVVPEERLLVLNVKDGWEPLCAFLDKPVPEVGFPHAFRAHEHRNLFAKARRRAYGELVVGWVVPAVVVGVVVWKRAGILRYLRGE